MPECQTHPPAETPLDSAPAYSGVVVREYDGLRLEKLLLEGNFRQVRVDCVAIHYPGKVYSLPRPARHHHLIKAMVLEGHTGKPLTGEQGFLCSNGQFATRETAKMIALANEQILPGVTCGIRLQSEDLF